MADTSKVELSSESSESELSDDHEEEANVSSDCLSFGDAASSIHGEIPASIENAEKTVDEATIQELLQDHHKYPPQSEVLTCEDVPATQERIDYFYRVYSLKREKYPHIADCVIPDVLKRIPLALSFQTLLHLYWPGALICCEKMFTSTRCYGLHLYKSHIHPSPPPKLSILPSKTAQNKQHSAGTKMHVGEVSESESCSSFPEAGVDYEVDQGKSPAQSSFVSVNNKSSPNIKKKGMKRNSFSVGKCTPSSSSDIIRPESKSLSTQSKAQRRPLSPSSRPSPKCFKIRRLENISSTNASNNDEVSTKTDSAMESDEKHAENGANRARARLERSCTTRRSSVESESDGLIEDQQKYPPQHDPATDEDFIATEERIKYFMDVLETKLKKYIHLNSFRPKSPTRHIPLALSMAGFVRYYWPGKVVCCGSVRGNIAVLENHINRVHRPPKSPPVLSLVPSTHETQNGIQNAESDVSDEITISPNVSRNRVGVMLNKSSSTFPPGFMEDQNKYPPQHKPGEAEDFLANQEAIDYFQEVFQLKCSKYSNLKQSRNMPLGGSYPTFVLNYWPGAVECCDRVYTTCKSFQLHLTSHHVPPKRPPHLSIVPTNPALTAGPSSSSVIDQRNGGSSTKNVLTNLATVQDDVRMLRQQMMYAGSMPQLLPMLEKIFRLVRNVTENLQMTSSQLPRMQLIEILEFVWNASKYAIVRWDELKESKNDPFLSAIRYAYQTVPVFINWDLHVSVIENVAFLCHHAIRNWKTTNTSMAGGSSAVAELPKVKEETKEADATIRVLEFCRVANVCVAQNTKARAATDYKDNSGSYHPMYRYGITQILKLFCPPSVEKLQCCDRIFELDALRSHILKIHDSKMKVEPSISPV